MNATKDKPTVLIIDDEPTNLRILRETLVSDHTVFIANNGKDGLNIAALKNPDLILLDIMMPEMDGYEVCETLKTNPKTKDILVIFVTAKDDDHEETEGFALGAVDYITKPFSKSVVLARVKNHMSLKWHRDELRNAKEHLEIKVTERTSQLNDMLQEKQNLLVKSEVASAAKTNFLAMISHGIRTPIHSNVGFGQLLLRSNLDAKQKQYAKMVIYTGEILQKTIDDILDFAMAEEGKLTLKNVEFNPFKTIYELAENYRNALETKGVELKFDFGKDVPLNINGDKQRLRQIITSLLFNSVKFTKAGFVRVGVNAVCRKPRHVILCFSVEDTGIGIEGEMHDALFDPFVKPVGSTGYESDGLGLGLAIAKKLASLMTGELSMQSTAGKGSVFRFTAEFEICVHSGDAENESANSFSETAPVTVDKPDTKTLQGCKVLVADDDFGSQEVVKYMLARIGCQAEVVYNGQEVIDSYSAYDIVLIDLEMPVVDGYAATRFIRSQETEKSTKPVTIVALTSHSFDDTREKCMAAGMNDYLNKPLEIDLLEETLKSWFNNGAH